jgi:hypothetical protein
MQTFTIQSTAKAHPIFCAVHSQSTITCPECGKRRTFSKFSVLAEDDDPDGWPPTAALLKKRHPKG